eukprot:TRINITY_DN21893_c0_g1_i1.p4 TRINITY_DN21893_c0_g1~~TRINITY_DN21893_c0_g1_i1.p4  ORF type:complete len:106 (-),score=6.21 TRINITY_DN21893_c0_g1_i1:182-499(-)
MKASLLRARPISDLFCVCDLSDLSYLWAGHVYGQRCSCHAQPRYVVCACVVVVGTFGGVQQAPKVQLDVVSARFVAFVTSAPGAAGVSRRRGLAPETVVSPAGLQ